jgi:hypothetical protein
MTRRDQFPAFLEEMLESPPHAGEGVHDWLFRVARQLHAHLPAGEIVSLLENRVATCGRLCRETRLSQLFKIRWRARGSPAIRQNRFAPRRNGRV